MQSIYTRPSGNKLRVALRIKMFALLRHARRLSEPGYPEGTDRWSTAARKLASVLHTMEVGS